MSFVYNDAIFFLLIFMRIAGIFFFTPFFSSDAVNRRMRLGLVFFITIIIFALVPKEISVIENMSFGKLAVLVIKETLIGVIIGYFMLMIFSAVQMAAQIYSNDMGFGMVNVFDPLSQFQIPVLGQFKYLFMLALFFILGFHRNMIYFIIESFYKIKVGMITYHSNVLAEEMMKNFGYYFEISVKLSLPILGVLFVTDVLLGIMARIAPQMNVFFVGMPLKILVGFVFLIASVPYIVSYFEFMLNDGFQRVVQVLKLVIT